MKVTIVKDELYPWYSLSETRESPYHPKRDIDPELYERVSKVENDFFAVQEELEELYRGY